MTDTNDINSADIWLKPKIRTSKPKTNTNTNANTVDTNKTVGTNFNNRNINFKINNVPNSNFKTNSNLSK